MHFEWDAAKARANERKHAVSFEEAASVFRGHCTHRPDMRRDYVLLNVVYTLRSESIRIISAWKASRYERQTYEKAYPDGAL